MLGAILFIAAFAVAFIALIILSVMKKKKQEKDGQVIDLADFEYDSKEQVFRKKRGVNDEFLDKIFDSNTNPTYWGLSGGTFSSNDDD